MKLKNQEIVGCLKSLEPMLVHKGKFGYICAVNYKRLSNSIEEYHIFENQLIQKYGKEDEDGNFFISQKDESFVEFMKELSPIQEITHDVDILFIGFEEVMDFLTGEEMLALDWMLLDTYGGKLDGNN